MADSKRQSIADAVVSALNAVSSLWVSEDLVHWEEVEKRRFPIVAFPIDHDEVLMENSLLGMGSDDDMKATLSFTVTCYCYDAKNDGTKLRKLRTDLIRDAWATLQIGTTLWSLIQDIHPRRVTTDRGVVKYYSTFDLEFDVDYVFGHEAGG